MIWNPHNVKKMSIKNKKHVQEYIYDFAEDGGATGEIDLHAKDNKSVIPVGAIITAVAAKVVTACTSAGSATVAWGNEDDEDGYSGSAIGVASLTDNALFNGWDNAAALLWDNTNKHQIPVNVADSADGEFKMTIGDKVKTIKGGDSYYIPPMVMHGCTCVKDGQLIDVFSPIREDFME